MSAPAGRGGAGATHPGRLASLRHGRVVAFSPERCTGEVEDGSGRYPFHCVEIADGTRRIADGTPVVFALRAAHGGSLEAVQLVAAPTPPTPPAAPAPPATPTPLAAPAPPATPTPLAAPAPPATPA